MTPRGLGGTIQDLNRLREILLVLARNGLGFFIDKLNLGAYLPARHRVVKAAKTHLGPERVRLIMEELGPTFVKLGQVLSMRPDIIPEEYVAEFSKLQDQVPPFTEKKAEKVVEEELGGPLSQFFKSFDPEPVAAASLAQVHAAYTLKGQKVAVKVQRPGLKRIINSDIEILRFLARAWENVSSGDFPKRPVEFIDEFEAIMREELDFLAEARHLKHFKENFRNRPAYRFPNVFWDLSNSRCLTIEYIEGDRFTNLAELPLSEKKRHALAQTLIDAFFLMILEDRFFQADPHAGNFILDREARIGFIDAGQVGRLDQETSGAFTDMLLALVNADTDSLVDAYLRLGTATEAVDRRRLKKDTELFLEQYYALPVERISFGKALQDLIKIAVRHRIQLPSEFVVMGKTFLGVEGLARQLNPKLNLVEAARPTAERILRKRYEPQNVVREFSHRFKLFKQFILGLPGQVQDLLSKLQLGRLKIEFEHMGLENLQHSLDRSSNRLSFSLIVAALIVGSSLILASQIGPTWQGISVLGLIGFLLAGLLGVWLIIAILRSGRM
jgi:ubiquinone biosynthesis protein